MNLTKFYKVPLVALLTLTAVYPSSAVLAEEGTEIAPITETIPESAPAETTSPEATEPAPTEPAPVTQEPAPVEPTPAPVESAPEETAPVTQEPEASPTEPEVVEEPTAPALTDSTGETTPTNTNTQISVSGEIQVVQPSFSTDFDSLFFTGTVGEENNSAVAKMGVDVVTSPSIYMVARENYSLMISGTDLMTTQGTLFTVGRMGVQVDNGSLVRLSTLPTLIDSGAGQLSIRKSIAFQLDLSMRNNSYPDNDGLQALTEDTEFTNTITFSYTGL